MGTPVVLEWRNLNLTIEKSEFKYLKCSKRVEKKTILENGIIKSNVKQKFFHQNHMFSSFFQ